MAAWLAAAVPVLFLCSLLWQYRLPAEVTAGAVALAGEWRALESLLPGSAPSAAPSQDEPPEAVGGEWKSVRVPGSLSQQGLSGPAVWLEKELLLSPAQLQSATAQDWALRLFTVRGAGFSIFFNGHDVGRGHPLKPDQDVFLVRSEWLQPRNVLRIHFRQAPLGSRFDGGFEENRLLLGRARSVGTFFRRTAELKGFLYSGLLFVTPVFMLVLLVLRRLEPNRTRQKLRGAGIRMLAGAALVAWGARADFLGAGDGGLSLRYALPALFAWAVLDFGEEYALGRTTNLRRVLWGLLAGVTALNLMGALSQATSALVVTSLWTSGALYLAVYLYAGSLAMRQLANKDSRFEFAPLVVVSAGVLLFCALSDFQTEIGLGTLPRLMTVGAAQFALSVCALLVGQFIRLAYRNQLLTGSLSAQNLELTQALAQAQESARTKGEFVANVSHELRTPLNAILNIPGGLMENFSRRALIRCASCQTVFEPDGDEQLDESTECPECNLKGGLSHSARWDFSGDSEDTLRNLQKISRSGSHLLNLINSILDFSKLEAGRMVLQLQPISAADVITDVCATMEPNARAKNVRLEGIPPQGAVVLKADPLRLTQVLINLVGNAIKFSPAQARVEVSVTAEGAFCVFRVRDEGVGIAQENLGLIFESFRQVEGSHTRQVGGTGLGLSISKNLIELHGGQLSVESQLGKGSTFLAKVPITGPTDGNAVHADASGTRRRRVLVVDSEPLSAEAMVLALRATGAMVTALSDGTHFMQTVNLIQPDLIILDALLPSAKGLQLLAELRTNERTRELPVMVVGASEAIKEKAKALGGHWLAAPWTLEALAVETQALLSPQQGISLGSGNSEPVPVPGGSPSTGSRAQR